MGLLNPDEDGLAAFLGPTGWPNFLPTPISGADNGMLHGDLGYSIDSGEPVGSRIARAALPTAILAGFALFFWLLIAILLGVFAAIKRYSFFDQAATVFAYVGLAMPTFWLGLMLIFLFGVNLKWLPVQRDDRDAALAAVRQRRLLARTSARRPSPPSSTSAST